ncbi:hypothetical protein V6N12_058517 [Hibiscus sabdariffa]|uniref:Uncharacterized protein n=1 Tax=Hibiscus sabdariffa TaxID=183260 RepID=A0ABR2ESG9_9ROSI
MDAKTMPTAAVMTSPIQGAKDLMKGKETPLHGQRRPKERKSSRKMKGSKKRPNRSRLDSKGRGERVATGGLSSGTRGDKI